ncbi:MAG TPA: hypothetical protein ENI37_05620 [Chloroflexi bacterium]|nr:hypothetical protein [Chloroflexota bacterium]
MRYLTPAQCRWIAIGLLLLLFAQLTTSAAVKSPTFDEPLHAVHGYVDLVTGDWRMQEEHPPLIHLLTGPFFWLLPNRPDPRALPGWVPFNYLELAGEVFHAFDLHPDVLIFPSRVVVMLLTLLLGATLHRWAVERHGPLGGLLALFVCAFSPNILAHGRLITTDLTLTCCFFLAVYAFQRLLVQPAAGWLAVASLTFGLALGAKASALLLIPVFALLTLLRSSGLGASETEWPRTIEEWFHRLASCVGWLTLTGLLAFLVLWALYGFETGSWAEGWPSLPLPTYLKALLYVRYHDQFKHPAFLMGQRSGGGWWQYFPIALALKTPLPTLIGALVGTAWLLWRRRWWAVLVGIVPPTLIFTAALSSSLNIGYRHILPVVPFLVLLVAALAELPWHRVAITVAGGGMALWLVAGTLGIYPDYLAYFNELAGGPGGGHRYLTDSNLDWGQDLIRLRDYLQAQGIERVYLSYFGNVNPAEYGIHYTPLPSHFSLGEVTDFAPFAPAAGFYAISVTNLSGQYLIENPSVLDWFNHQTPIASIGHSINVYQVLPDASPPTWVGICFAPGVPLDDEAFSQGVGRDDLRFARFDCRNSWLYAEGGRPAWIVVPATNETEGLSPPIGSWRVVFEQENYDGKQLFTIYRWEAREALEAHLAALEADPLVTPPLPVNVGNNLALLDYEVHTPVGVPGDELRLTTYWRVLAQTDRPLSLMAHLVDQTGHPVAVGDTLGVPIEGWAPGDIIAQTHRLALDTATTPGHYRLQTGAYWWPEVERLPATDAAGNPLPDNAIPLIEVEVEAAP